MIIPIIRLDNINRVSVYKNEISGNKSNEKLVLLYGFTKNEQPYFANCRVNRCNYTKDLKYRNEVDAIMFKTFFGENFEQDFEHVRQNTKQIWIMYALEAPPYTPTINDKRKSFINWTATYRRDSDIVTPYAKWVYYNRQVGIRKSLILKRNIVFFYLPPLIRPL